MYVLKFITQRGQEKKKQEEEEGEPADKRRALQEQRARALIIVHGGLVFTSVCSRAMATAAASGSGAGRGRKATRSMRENFWRPAGWAPRGRGPADTVRLRRGAMVEATDGESTVSARLVPAIAPMRARRADGGVDGAELAEAAAGSAARGTRLDAEDNRRRLCDRRSACVVVTGAAAPFADTGRCQGQLTAGDASGEGLAATVTAANSGDGADGNTGAIGDERAESASDARGSKMGVQGRGMSGSPSSPASAAVCEGEASGASISDAAAAAAALAPRGTGAPSPSATVAIIAMTLRGE